MAEKKMAEKKMEEKKMEETPKVAPLIETELKQKQSVLDLDTMSESDIVLVYTKYTSNDKAPVATQLAAISKLVHPDEKRVDALCKFATSEGYQKAKAAALAKGNYLTSQLKSALTQLMSNIEAFAENSAKDNIAKWLDAYKSGDPKRQALAKKLLDRAKLLVPESDEYSGL